MTATPDPLTRLLFRTCAGAILLGQITVGTAEEVPIVHPGAPGEPARELSADEAIDFTDSANPVEIAFFDRGPIDAEELIVGGFWSAYWYDGKIYGTEIVRGLDVLRLLPSEYLSENEIAAAALADQGGVFNPQQQFPVTWPAEPVVARAYVDQLERSEALATALIADLNEALDRSASQLEDGGLDKDLAADLESLAADLEDDSGDAITNKRRAALSDTVGGIAARLR